MRITDNETRWVKMGQITSLSFVGKDVIVYGKGCHLVFINLQSGEELTYTANHQKVGDGISCFTGHRAQNVFAFAEKRTNPTVFIKNYPNFEEVRLFKDVEVRGYVGLAFTETSLLLTLGDLPKFNLTVWNWRKGEKIADSGTSIWMQNQAITSNLCNPAVFTQMGIGTTVLHIWDIFICGKKTVLTKHVTKSPPNCNPFTSVAWTTENALFVLDTQGCVYTMYPNYQLEKVIDFTEKGDTPTSIAWYKSGLVVLGPTNEIRHYKKSGTWSMDWSISGTEPLLRIFAKSEYLLVVTKEYDLLQVQPTQNSFTSIKTKESDFNDICIVNPTGEYLMALCHHNTLNLYTVVTGEKTSTLLLEEHGLTLSENPRFSYVAVGLECGKVLLSSVYKPKKLAKMTEFHLTRLPIHKIIFNENGTVMVAAHLTTGLFFIIEGIPGGDMVVVMTVEAHRQIVDFMMVLSEDCYRIFCVPVTSSEVAAGDRILRFCSIKGKKTDLKEYRFKERGSLYTRLCPIFGGERDRRFYLVPYYSKYIEEVETKKGDNVANVLQKIITGHQMREIFLRRDKNICLTWAFDGFVILRSSDFTKNIAIALPHHRIDGGVKKACVDPYHKYLVSLGRDNILVCTNLMEQEINTDLKNELALMLNSPNYRLMFGRQTTGYIPKGLYLNKCFTEVQEMKKIETERAKCEKDRNNILKEFKAIQADLQDLITHNLEGSDNEKLDMIEFNLHTSLYKEKCEHQKKLRKATEVYLKNLIEAQNRVSEYIMTNYWHPMQIQETVIKGIFSNFEVKNYCLRPQGINDTEELKKISHQRKVERYLNELNHFHPWEPIPENELINMIAARPGLPSQDEDMVAIMDLDATADEVTEEQVLSEQENLIAFSGSDLQRYIEIQEAHYLQSELVTFLQADMQWKIAKNDSYKLKEKFNSMFNAVMAQKEKDMSTIKERNARLRHIVSEINYFSEEKIRVRIEDPEWIQVETPELIIQVKDDEVPITPYISPSEQARLDAQAAEEERIRLLLLADDFRERALMAMMNGVLEVRWEDELKKDVPLPKCMVEKEPENYNEEDLKVIKDYEEKVKFLHSERRRYKFMLFAEYKKLSHQVREQIDKFNAKLSHLLYEKLLIDAAISQETMKIARTTRFQRTRAVILNSERDCIVEMTDNEEVVRNVHDMLQSLHEAVSECKANMESYQFKDKILEKGFKKDFQDMSLVVQEQASKLYRKRPKINIRSINSSTILNELGKCIMSNTKPPPTLSPDCVEFLKSLDNLDQYIGVPSVVDEHTYVFICRHRRLRIEYEIKSRAAQCELTEAEATLSAFQKRLSQKKEVAIKLVEQLNEVRTRDLNIVKNKEIQIVLPRGLVEIPLTGSVEDFNDAVLICRKDVNDINSIILEFGDRKIHSMQQGMSFRRKILAKEWNHKRLRMLIQDLREKIVDINGIKLTKEIQSYLKSKDKDKVLPFETEVDMIKASYENTIQDMREKVNRMNKQIRSLQGHVKIIDHKIQDLNIDVCDLNLMRDKELDSKERAIIDSRMKTLLKRTNLVKLIQDNHHEILMLQTELELLRLKTYPTLKYRVTKE